MQTLSERGDGTTEPINPQDFAARILALSNGEPIDGEVRIFWDDTKPASKWGGSWSEDKFPNGTFLMAAGSGGTAGISGGSNTHSHAVTLRYSTFWNNLCGEDNDLVNLKDSSNPDEPYSANRSIAGTSTFRTNSGLQSSHRDEEGIVSYESTGRTTVTDNRPQYVTVHIWRKVS